MTVIDSGGFLIKMGHLREYIEVLVPHSSQPLLTIRSRPMIDTILVGPVLPKVWGQPRTGVLVAGVNYNFAPSSIVRGSG